MNYSRPGLGERLAADYALGLMPPRARRRFEREVAGNATLAAAVAGWSERLGPLDAITADEPPPARVWRAIERRSSTLGPVRGPIPAAARGALAFWCCGAATAFAACAALALYIAIDPAPRDELAMLAQKIGLSAWVGTATQFRIGRPVDDRPRRARMPGSGRAGCAPRFCCRARPRR